MISQFVLDHGKVTEKDFADGAWLRGTWGVLGIVPFGRDQPGCFLLGQIAGFVAIRYCQMLKEKERMNPEKNSTGKGLRPTDPTPKLNPDQGRTPDGELRILARMIVRAYIKDLEKKRLIELGVRPKLFLERIYIAFDCVDMNDPKERQRLHQTIDEAIDEAVR